MSDPNANATPLPVKRRPGRPKGSKNRHNPPAPILPNAPLMPLCLRVDEAAAFLRIRTTSMKKLVSSGAVKSTRLGRTRLVHVASLKELVGA